MRRGLILLAAIFAVFPAEVLAQREVRTQGFQSNYSPMDWFTRRTVQLTFYRLPGDMTDYRIGPEDQLEIFIDGLSDRTVSVTVRNSGEITIPLIGSIQVAEMTTQELETAISERLTEKQLIQRPEVLVNVAEHQSRSIYVIGDVDNPGQYIMSQQLTLMEAIMLAGGLDYPADRYGYLHRRVSGGPRAPTDSVLQHPDAAQPGGEVIKIDLQPLKEGGLLVPDIPLRNGDVIVVPRRKVSLVYVIGDVQRPGAFEIPERNRMLVSQAISAAGGPSRTAKMSKGMLLRYDESGRRQESRVDFQAILRNKQPDLEVQPNDVIFIPGAASRSVAYGFLNVIPTMIQTAILF